MAIGKRFKEWLPEDRAWNAIHLAIGLFALFGAGTVLGLLGTVADFPWLLVVPLAGMTLTGSYLGLLMLSPVITHQVAKAKEIDAPAQSAKRGVTVGQIQESFSRQEAIAAAKEELLPRVELRKALQLINGEVGYGLHLLQSVMQSAFWWDPERRTLKADQWARYYESLAGESGLDNLYRTVEGAYFEFDRINHLVAARREIAQRVPVTEGSIRQAMEVQEGDRLSNAIHVAQEARVDISEAIRRIADS